MKAYGGTGHLVDVSGQLNIPAALSQGEGVPVPI
jgi:hypothetical protein